MASPLHKFEGREVVGARVAIINAGDGLSKAMAIEPEELKHDQTVWVVLEGVVEDVGFKRSKDDPGKLNRVMRIKAGIATLVDEELVKDVLETQRIAIEESEGVTRLDFGDEE